MKKLFTALATSIILILSTPAIAETSAHSQQIECLARNAYFEARGEGRAGIEAVTHVVINRTKQPKWPSTPCGVIYQRSRGSCQFSWVCTRNSIRDQRLYSYCRDLVTRIYMERPYDPTRGATFFHGVSVPGYWFRNNLRVTYRSGGHIFYRD